MFGKKPEGVEKKKQRRGISAVVWMFMGSLLTLMIGVFLYLWQPFKAPGDTVAPNDGRAVNNQDSDSGSSSTTSASSGRNSNAQSTSNQTDDNDYQFYDLLPEQEVTPIPDQSIPVQNDNTSKQRADVTLKLPTEEFDNDQTYSPADTYDGEPSTTQAPTESTQNDSASSDHNSEGSSSSTNKPVDPIENIINQTEETVKNAVVEGIQKSKKASYILQINSFNTAEEADKRRAEVLLAGIDANVVKKTNNGETMYQVISESYDSKTGVFMAQQRLQSSGIDAFVVERKK